MKPLRGARNQHINFTMAEAVPQKRVLPPRERRESAAKRRASSPMAPPSKVATPKKPTPKSTPRTASTRSHKKKEPSSTPVPSKSVTPAIEEILPTKVTEGQLLPTIRTKQGENLSSREYQSIAESAVLAVSMHQSRTKWLGDEMFTKYWTKPSKKKGAPELPNPDVKSMSKLGPCTMVIEPHSFEVMMYTVRDQNAPAPQYRPPVYYPPPHPAYQPHPGYSNSPTPGPPVQARPPYSAQTPHMKQDPGRPYATPMAGPAQQPQHNAPGAMPKSQNGTPVGPGRPASTPHQQKPGSGPNSDSEKNPVIQKLATAAASDPDLKALMQVVASSRATPEQLRTFQRHLDRLNAQIARENADSQAKAAPNSNPNPTQPAAGPASTPNTAPVITPVKKEPEGSSASTPVATQAPPHTNSTPVHLPNGTPQSQPNAQSAMMTPQPRPAQPKIGSMGPPVYGAPYASYPPPPPPQPLVKHIVFENLAPVSSVQGSNQDRYIFPEYAVLDFSPDPRGTVILASFFVIRKGSQINDSPTTGGTLGREKTFYKDDEEYYQVATMRLIASNPKVLETIARAAKPLKVVQEWMGNVIKTKKRAEDCFLPLRLPRVSTGQEGILSETGGNVGAHVNLVREDDKMVVGSYVNGGHEMEFDDELKDVYEQPDSLVPLSW